MHFIFNTYLLSSAKVRSCGRHTLHREDSGGVSYGYVTCLRYKSLQAQMQKVQLQTDGLTQDVAVVKDDVNQLQKNHKDQRAKTVGLTQDVAVLKDDMKRQSDEKTAMEKQMSTRIGKVEDRQDAMKSEIIERQQQQSMQMNMMQQAHEAHAKMIDGKVDDQVAKTESLQEGMRQMKLDQQSQADTTSAAIQGHSEELAKVQQQQQDLSIDNEKMKQELQALKAGGTEVSNAHRRS